MKPDFNGTRRVLKKTLKDVSKMNTADLKKLDKILDKMLLVTTDILKSNKRKK